MEHKLHEAAAAAVLVVHLIWLLWVMLAVLVTRGRRSLTVLHVLSLVWGIAVEVSPCPCPLTTLEQHLQHEADTTTYTQSCIVHYLEKLVYPDIPEAVLMAVAVSVCLFNLGIYVACYRRSRALSAIISF
jgi:Protein of Unknown function (DUF2784)